MQEEEVEEEEEGKLEFMRCLKMSPSSSSQQQPIRMGVELSCGRCWRMSTTNEPRFFKSLLFKNLNFILFFYDIK